MSTMQLATKVALAAATAAGFLLPAQVPWMPAITSPAPETVSSGIDGYRELPACPAEDSPGPCYWDAGTRGNGVGRSFWVDGDQQVHYLDGRPARHGR